MSDVVVSSNRLAGLVQTFVSSDLALWLLVAAIIGLVFFLVYKSVLYATWLFRLAASVLVVMVVIVGVMHLWLSTVAPVFVVLPGEPDTFYSFDGLVQARLAWGHLREKDTHTVPANRLCDTTGDCDLDDSSESPRQKEQPTTSDRENAKSLFTPPPVDVYLEAKNAKQAPITPGQPSKGKLDANTTPGNIHIDVNSKPSAPANGNPSKPFKKPFKPEPDSTKRAQKKKKPDAKQQEYTTSQGIDWKSLRLRNLVPLKYRKMVSDWLGLT